MTWSLDALLYHLYSNCDTSKDHIDIHRKERDGTEAFPMHDIVKGMHINEVILRSTCIVSKHPDSTQQN